jgi:23S rRNA pseudouridine1911/1915/1917 synthase
MTQSRKEKPQTAKKGPANTPPRKTKQPSRRHLPRGLTILHEDDDIIVVDKVSGLLSMSNSKTRDRTAYFALNDYVRKGNAKSRKRIFIVHRLDRDTSGVLVFAKSEVNKRFLQDQWPKFKKSYFAVVHGVLKEKEGIFSSYLAENAVHRMYATDDPKKGKLAKTGYKVLKESTYYSLVEIDLLTGRKNQIRVHFADAGHPVAGDQIYGDQLRSTKHLNLHAGSLTLVHPGTKKRMTFKADLPSYFNALLKK